jgi:hypothetical protein
MSTESSKARQQGRQEIRRANSIEGLAGVVERVRLKHGTLPFFKYSAPQDVEDSDQVLAELQLLQRTAQRMGALIKEHKIRRFL